MAIPPSVVQTTSQSTRLRIHENRSMYESTTLHPMAISPVAPLNVSAEADSHVHRKKKYDFET